MGDGPLPPFDQRNAQHFDKDYERAEPYKDKHVSSAKVFQFSSLFLLLTPLQAKGKNRPIPPTMGLIRRPLSSGSDNDSDSSVSQRSRNESPIDDDDLSNGSSLPPFKPNPSLIPFHTSHFPSSCQWLTGSPPSRFSPATTSS